MEGSPLISGVAISSIRDSHCNDHIDPSIGMDLEHQGDHPNSLAIGDVPLRLFLTCCGWVGDCSICDEPQVHRSEICLHLHALGLSVGSIKHGNKCGEGGQHV